MKEKYLDQNKLYRLPWTLPDNAISWLEPTAMCNLFCDGCYRENEKNSHKPFEEVKHELDVFQYYRKSDCISIAGGDPLLYPHLIDLVKEIKRRGIKPIINTNGKALTPQLLKDLKKAGVFGFTFHVDSRQGRDGKWKDKNDLELNELRLEYAEMLAREGGIACSFNSTVYEENLKYVPEMVKWAQEHIDIVQTMVFICFRHVVPDMPFDWYADGRKIDWEKIWYHSDEKREIEIKSTDLVKKVREAYPEFTPAAYLNGTEAPEAFKWLLTQRVGTKKRIYGHMGPKFMELMMAGYHFLFGKYLSYASPKTTRHGKSVLLLWPFDKEARRAAGRILANPLNWFRRAHFQTILFIQPVDFMENGAQSMCDGCPDMTVHEDQLVWSCRLEEPKKFGTFIRSVPKDNGEAIEA